MKVTLVDSMGNDLSVVNAARVSFSKKSEMIHDSAGERLSDADKKLLTYLAKHGHWTPFGHTAVTLHIKAPLFVARQLGKHQVGLVWNEVSRRYVDSTPEFYVPGTWRERAVNVKQGSSDVPIDVTQDDVDCLKVSLNKYHELLDSGVCPEQARMVLPQSMVTEWYWTGNLYAFYNVWKLRSKPDTQAETRQVADQIGNLMSECYPHSWSALQEDKL